MRVAIERLRSWIVVLAGLLLIGILLFFAVARWQFHRMAHDLPGKLGISIQQSTTGFTFSKSEGGHTIFTLHAAKTTQYKNGGRADLHDVSITLYSPDGAQADRIYGDEFEYDPAKGIVRANGVVQIDLQGPAASAHGNSENVVHVKTAGLIFNEKTGLASTSDKIEFRIAEASGSALGATFDSRTGVLVMGSEVAFNSSLDGSPLVLRAHHAQFDRASRQLYLLQNATDYDFTHNSSDQAIVYFRQDGSAYQIKSQGHVTTSSDGEKISSQGARVDLDAQSEPVQAILDGGVLYAADNAARHLYGNSASAILSFGSRAAIRHAQLRTTVSFVDEEKTPPSSVEENKRPGNHPLSTTREVTASQIDIDFARTPDRRPLAQDVLAVGTARLDIRSLYANTSPQETGVSGDRLFVRLRDGIAVSNLRGTGHTQLVLLDSNGVKQISTGDTLYMTFAAPAGAKAASTLSTGLATGVGPQQAAPLESCDQQGNVRLERQTLSQNTSGKGNGARNAPPAGSQSSDITAIAQRATYAANTQVVTLTGDPRIQEANGELSAATIQFDRTSGNATVIGGVKATYRQTGEEPAVSFGGTDPVHVIAAHASLDHEKDLITFYGAAHEDARLWQGGDSISSPVLAISRSRQTLTAGGVPEPGAKGSRANGPGAKPVNAVFTSSGVLDAGNSTQAKSTQSKTRQPGKPGQVSVVRVNSRTLLYSGLENKAAFRGGVVAQNASGVIRANDMDLFFGVSGPVVRSPSTSSGTGSKPAVKQTKQLERIVAQGKVELEQLGRKGTGEELVYTTQDGKFVLTGTNAAPPHLVDPERGTVTGTSLIFNDRDDSVIVNGGPSRVVTETRTAK